MENWYMFLDKAELIEKNNCIVINKYLNICLDIFKYGLVSFFALAVDIGFLYIMVEYIHMYYIAAATIAFCFGLSVNYTLGKIFVFKNSKLPLLQEFIWYTSIGIMGLVINDLIIYLLVRIQLWYLTAKAVSVVVVFFFNFFGRRRLFAN
jgi:putative flippase GtrA